ncbi:MAG TPA: chemotaxis protein CheX [Polyangia bacterium]|jgi:hypothetical protein|nr:chemotaxis protein CheX [Polyangia bacterium]
MSTLPEPEVLARLISNVTAPMCGTTFAPGDPLARGESLCGQMAMIPLKGERNFTVVVSSDTRGSRALGSALFGCADAALTQEMIDDAIAELLNMVAGQISSSLRLNLALGLPHRTTLAEIIASGGDGIADAALFRSQGTIDLWLWVFENHRLVNTNPLRGRSVLRSLLQKLRPPTFTRR